MDKRTDALTKTVNDTLDASLVDARDPAQPNVDVLDGFVVVGEVDFQKIIADAVAKIETSIREERRLLRALVGSPEFGSVVRSTTLRSMYQQWVDEYR